MRLLIHQIWFDEESRRNCFEHPAVEPHENAHLTPYFENDVILALRPYSGDYVGVWSHRAKDKIRNEGNFHFSMDKLVEIVARGDFDVLGFHHSRTHVVVLDLDAEQRVRFDSIFDCLMKCLELPYRSTDAPRFPVLHNHFIARANVMNDYAAFLARAREAMETDPVLKRALANVAPYRTREARRYTYHPFVCERLFSAYLHLNPSITCRFYVDYHPLT